MAPYLSEEGHISAENVANSMSNLKMSLQCEASQELSNPDQPHQQPILPVPNPGKSFWGTAPHPLASHRSTESLPSTTDILIIGSGYAGAATAYHLTRSPQYQDQEITILEARTACSGATGRNGGHLRPDLYGHIPTYIDRAGIEAGAEVARFEVDHVQAIKRVVEEEGIECEFRLCRSWDVWCDPEAAGRAREVYERLRGLSMKEEGKGWMDDVVFYEGDVEGICGVKGAKACASYTAGTLWPSKFILSILTLALSSGHVNLQTHTPATSIRADPSGGWTVSTPRGDIHAKKVVHASNAFVSGLLPEYSSNIIPCKGICCRIAVPEGKVAPLLNNSYINRTENGTLSYLIPRSDGSIIVGGAAAVFKAHREQWYGNIDDSSLIESAKDYYKGYMQSTYRGWEDSGAEIESIWTGVMGYSYDSNPHVGSVPGKEGQLILAGFNGHGMPVIWLTAKDVAKMILEDVEFEGTGLPRLFKTTPERIDRARNGKVEDGDILGVGKFSATKQ